ncbi:coat protein [Cactus tobamovirus 2]|nr:coat protein [Cactus tobamovirus 2]UPI40908.1 coat protein [Cactus tobamovirus 2]
MGSYTNIKPSDFAYKTKSWVNPTAMLNYFAGARESQFQTQQARTQLLDQLRDALVYGPTDTIRFPENTYLVNTMIGPFRTTWSALTQACDTKDRVFEVDVKQSVTSIESKLATQRVDDATIAIRKAIELCIDELSKGNFFDRTTFESTVGWIWQSLSQPPPSTARTS